MARIRQVKTNFTAGEISRDLLGRGDLRPYENGALRLRNLFIYPTGGVTRRAGLCYIDTVAGDGRLIAFEFNTEQTYLLCLNDRSMSIYAGGIRVATLATPWTSAQIPQVSWTQSADTLLMTHPDVPPKKLVRLADGSFALEDWIFFSDGGVVHQPYYKFAQSDVTVTPSATTGTITLNFSAALLDSGHVGVRMRIATKEVIIEAVNSPTVATATVIEELSATEPTIDWAEAAFSPVRGYPVTVAFHQDRLVIGGSRDMPNRLWFSKSGDLFNFDLGQGLDDEAIEFAILSDQVNAIRGIFSGRHLQVFTSGAEWMVTGDPLTPQTVQLKRQTRVGSRTDRYIPPVTVDGATMFIARSGTEIREFLYTDLEQAYQATDLALLSRHVLGRAVDQDFDARRRLLFIVRDDGKFATHTIYRAEAVSAWTLHETQGDVRAVSVVGDEVYLLIRRGNDYFIEMFDDALNLDSALGGTVTTPAREWSGLAHLEGYDVSIVADGVVLPPHRVTNGKVTLERRLPLERMTDFLEGGDFSARAINHELDYLTASLQQLERDLSPMLRYTPHETPACVTLPTREKRANKALGFDGNGDPVAVSLEGSMAAPDVSMAGIGAITRTTQDKLSDTVSVKDFGALGNGLSDDTLAFQQALSAHDSVYVPPGTFLISAPITLGERQALRGAGQVSVIECRDNDFNAVEIVADFATLADLRINGGDIAVKLYGRDRPCVQTSVTDVAIFGANIGVQLDGHENTERPCYWNNFDRVVISQPALHGVHLIKSGAGDSPNANKFHACRVYSHGADITGHGFYIEHGAHNNAFVDCEANVKGTAQSCFTIGAGSLQTILINPYAESYNLVANVVLENGSAETTIYNLLAMSDGAAIHDLSGGNYAAFNAGYPYKNRLPKTMAPDIMAALQRYDAEYLDESGEVTLDLSHSVHLVSSYNGALTLKLPPAAEALGVMMVVKKIDISDNVITVEEEGGAGPDGRSYYLGAENDFVQMVSNGAEWFVISSNRAPGNDRYFDGSGTYDIDMAVDTYLLSSYNGVLEARLPPANAAIAKGRTITIKKTDPSVNAVNVTEYGGSGPDGETHVLNAQFKAVTVVSNGAQWYVVSKL